KNPTRVIQQFYQPQIIMLLKRQKPKIMERKSIIGIVVICGGGASGIKQLKVTSKLGKDATAAERKKAVNYGKDQIGEPYKLKTTIWSTDAWYCSKLTNAQWDYAGYNLQSSRAFHIDGILAVIPNDILNDANTRVKKNWGTSLPGKI
ncbi:hypothetical protein CVN76_06385, partial [Bacillus sp. mrc49]